MTNIEELVFRYGMDAASLEKGLLSARAAVEVEAAKTKQIWAETDRAIAAENQVSLDASFARYEANLAKKKAADDAYFAARRAKIEEQNAISAIGAGSGGTGWRNAAGRAEGGAVREGEYLAEGAAAGAVGAHGVRAGVFRESAVLVREAFRKNWTRMIGSITLLFQYLGITAATIISSIPIIGAAAATAWGMISASRGMTDNQGEVDSQTTITKHLNSEIERLFKSGKITDAQKSNLVSRLGTMAGIRGVQQDLVGMGAFKPDDREEIAELNAKTRAEDLADDREKMSHLERIKSLAKQHSDLLEKMNGLDVDSIGYAQNKYDQAKLLKEMDKERLEITKEQKELQNSYDSERLSIAKIYSDVTGIDVEAPTIRQLAGRSFEQRLNMAYGKGGRYDLESGDGPFAGTAQAAELAAKQESWDIIHGNAQWRYNSKTGKNELIGGQAYEDRSRRMANENLLWQAGLQTPAMKIDKANQDINDTNTKIGLLLKAATVDGIVLIDKP